jgi:hypothetical protein
MSYEYFYQYIKSNDEYSHKFRITVANNTNNINTHCVTTHSGTIQFVIATLHARGVKKYPE